MRKLMDWFWAGLMFCFFTSTLSGCIQEAHATRDLIGSQFGMTTTVTFTVTVATDADLTDEQDLEDYTLGTCWTDSNFDGTQIEFHGAPSSGGTFAAIKTSADAACTVTTAATQPFTAPSGDCALTLAGIRYAKIETVTDQTTEDTTITCQLKR